MTNKEKLQKIFPNIMFTGTVMIYKQTEQVLASNINYNWLNAEYKEPTTKNDLGIDPISRVDVLKLIYDYKENHSNDREHYPINYGTLIDMIRWVRELPSVTPQEPKTGHWMKSNIGGAKVCSVCNAHMGLSSFKFCPNCEAKMIEPQKSEEQE